MINLKPKIYGLSFFFAFFFLFTPSISHATCSSVPLTGDYILSAHCTFPTSDNIGGVDNGNITINATTTLTINDGQTIAWGPGKSLIINDDASIAIADGGQLKQGRICRTDADGDGYITTSTPTVASTCTGLITQADIHNATSTNWADISYDSNDTASSTYPGTACDGDCTINNTDGSCGLVAAGENGLPVCQRCNGTSTTHVNIATFDDDEATSTCAGTCAAYCSSGSCISTDTGTSTCTVATDARLASGGDGHCTSSNCVSDCTSNGESCSVDGDCCDGNCYTDADSDGYGTSTGSNICYAAASSGSDCCDSDANAHPGQTTYYTTARTTCGGYDYDCDGEEQKSSPWCHLLTGYSINGTCEYGSCDGGASVTHTGTDDGAACGSTFNIIGYKYYYYDGGSCSHNNSTQIYGVRTNYTDLSCHWYYERWGYHSMKNAILSDCKCR